MHVLNHVYRRKEEENLAAAKADAKSPQLNRVYAAFSTCMVGERSIRGEVRAEALVDCMEVRMPE